MTVGIFHCLLLVAINFHAYISVLITIPKYLGLAVFYAIRRLMIGVFHCVLLIAIYTYITVLITVSKDLGLAVFLCN